MMTAERVAQGAVAAAACDERPRCWRCNKEMAVYLTRPWRIDCPRCRAVNQRDTLASDAPIR